MPCSRTFLIVDDNEDNRYLAGHALKKAFPGATVIEASAAEEVLRVAGQGSIDGVVTDHHLGTKDGPIFMQQLRGAGIICPIIMVTANTDPAVRRRAMEAGAARVFAGSDVNFVSYFKQVLAADDNNAAP